MIVTSSTDWDVVKLSMVDIFLELGEGPCVLKLEPQYMTQQLLCYLPDA